MTLDKWLMVHNINNSQFADMIGVTPQAVYYWRAGQRFPCGDSMYRITEVTKRQVMPNDFYPLRDKDVKKTKK